MTKPAKITIGRSIQPKVSHDGRTMVVSIPISLTRQGGRKKVVTPAHAPAWLPPPPRVDNTIIKALVRAHRWRLMLESNLFASVRELARAEKINESYLCRVLRLTLLSPQLTEAILNGQQPEGLDLKRLLRSIPIDWEKQGAVLLTPTPPRTDAKRATPSRFVHRMLWNSPTG